MTNSDQQEPRGAGEALLRWLRPAEHLSDNEDSLKAIQRDRTAITEYLTWALDRSRGEGDHTAPSRLALLQGAIEAATVALAPVDYGRPSLWETCAQTLTPNTPVT